jgi:methionyl-tRNA formyltransferase
MILLDSELSREEVAFATKNVIRKGDLRRDLARMYLLIKPDTGDQVDQQEVKAWTNSNLGALENVLAQMGLESLLLGI